MEDHYPKQLYKSIS